MKTVSTKLDKSDFERFEKMCEESDMCASEWLRESIKDNLRAHKEARELEPTVAEPIVADVEPKPKVEPEIKFIFD